MVAFIPAGAAISRAFRLVTKTSIASFSALSRISDVISNTSRVVNFTFHVQSTTLSRKALPCGTLLSLTMADLE